MKQVWVIERVAPEYDDDLRGYWVHKTHQGAVATAMKMAKDDADDILRYDYRDNGIDRNPYVEANGNQIAVINVDGSCFMLYNIKQMDVGV